MGLEALVDDIKEEILRAISFVKEEVKLEELAIVEPEIERADVIYENSPKSYDTVPEPTIVYFSEYKPSIEANENNSSARVQYEESIVKDAENKIAEAKLNRETGLTYNFNLSQEQEDRIEELKLFHQAWWFVMYELSGKVSFS